MLKLCNATIKNQQRIITFPDLCLNVGEIVGLSGPSGCGKSTLAMALAGMQSLHSGSIARPKVATHNSANKNRPNSVQWVCQQPEFAFNPLWTLHKSMTESHPIDEAQLARYQIDPSWLKRYPKELSGGELQRLNLVRALAPDTRYLLCDEITAQLDTLTQQDIWQALCAEVDRGQLGLLVISHDEYLLDAICDRVIKFGTSAEVPMIATEPVSNPSWRAVLN
ncbi:MAG: ATP-binding cassette domain-containing protein [Moritella sp.]|uniref:ATP-binding cassette domain-containing protein n=1 Tax=Moritella sp. TaxID=78556 RepID=UPI0029B10770|nr:ATP-binding cassette domain-containing protein [Moritella sp.]MDX2320098.1 ATP-binding cassette domain-containing protein [Moritella sp.]